MNHYGIGLDWNQSIETWTLIHTDKHMSHTYFKLQQTTMERNKHPLHNTSKKNIHKQNPIRSFYQNRNKQQQNTIKYNTTTTTNTQIHNDILEPLHRATLHIQVYLNILTNNLPTGSTMVTQVPIFHTKFLITCISVGWEPCCTTINLHHKSTFSPVLFSLASKRV